MKKGLVTLVAALLVFSSVGLASALTIKNGSFESGDFTDWDANDYTGTATVVTEATAASGNIYTATDGIYFANLVADSALLQFGLTWNAGEKIGFDWAFLAKDYDPYNDIALFSLAATTNADTKTVRLSDVLTVGDFGDSGWQTYVYTFAEAGQGMITFGSLNDGDQGFQSSLLIDNVTNNPVPEPSTIILLGAGLLGLGFFGRKRMNKA